MNPLGQVVQNIAEALRQASDPNAIPRIKRTLNAVAHDYAELESWYTLRKSLTISFADDADANNSVLLPANLAGIDGIWDNAGNEYHASERSRAQMDTIIKEDQRFRWFYTDQVTQPLVFQGVAQVKKDASLFTCTPDLTWNADWNGEYVSFGNDPGYYLLTGDKTFSPAYRGEALNKVYFSIRPEGTKRISLSDCNGAYTGAEITIFYWTYPDALWNDSQRLPFPHSRAIELETMIRELGTKDKREAAADRYRDELHGGPNNPGGAMAIMRSLNRKFQSPIPPRNSQGQRVIFGKR